ncbi:uncharacterized protein [Rutidosis leptorrhynchoides]|uniref:uncharacterized protein n=1 Tax=Rutidosis leptorrhynchoides TaxID=125765 RepID=UPI003A98E485
MFLVSNCYATVLFDSGEDRSYMSTEFCALFTEKTQALEFKRLIEVSNGKVMKVDNVYKNYDMILADKHFKINLLPFELGSFDVVIGMDWLRSLRTAIMCYEKTINIPLENGETLIIQGEMSGSKLNIISCIKTRKYLMKRYQAILAHVKEVKPKEKRIEDVLVVRDFTEVFPEELPGLPPQRQVEFRIYLTPGVAPIANAPYRLAPSEMKGLSNQLHELLEKASITNSALDM